MKGYWSIPEAAAHWNVSERLVNQYCIEGRVPGAERFGRSWAIPEDVPRPGRQSRHAEGTAIVHHPMPLINTAFRPGHCQQAIQHIVDADERAMALAEYHYFSGQPEKAILLAERLLTHADPALRLSACFVYGYASFASGRIQQARYILQQMSEWNQSLAPDVPPETRCVTACITMGASVLLHLPLPQGVAEQIQLPLLPPGLRLFALYVRAHHAYLQKNYQGSLAIAETALALQADVYPIPAIYLHLMACIDCMSLRQLDRARMHMLQAWHIAQPDDLLEPLGEHHGLLSGMLEATLKKDWPQDFARVIAITYRFSAGWRKIHNPATGHDVADDLTTTEFAAAMLAARGWTNQEIGEHMSVSPSTIKRYISSALQKLGITQRKELKQFMLD